MSRFATCSFSTFTVLALMALSSACEGDADTGRFDAVDTSGLDGLPDPDTDVAETAEPDIEPADTTEVSPDVPQDTASDIAVDTTPELDTADALEPLDITPDTTPDTTPDSTPDTTPTDTTPDTSGPACECLEVGTGELGVVITNDGTNEPPTLGGLGVNSDPMGGLFNLDAITVYTKGAFDGVLITSATVTNDGETSGTVRFEDGHWAFLLDLDLSFNAQTVLGPNSGASRTLIEGGGCYELAGNLIVGDTSDCANDWPSGTTPPATFEFAYDATGSRFVLKVELSRAFVVALVPPEYELIANAAITGPIRFIAAFSPR